MSAASRKTAASASAPKPARLGLLDAPILAIVLGVATVLTTSGGLRRAVDLMPWPDGLEYAAMATNLDRGRGAVLHFGGYSYPSRYTEGYPLILAAAHRLFGRDVSKLGEATIVTGLLAIVALYVLTLELFGRPAALLASVLLAVSPIFVTYSALVLSDVPTLAVTILAALALARATSAEDLSARDHPALTVYWTIFGLLTGFTVMIRPTNATMLPGVLAGLLAAPPVGSRSQRAALLAAFTLGFALPPLWQMRENSVHLGGAFAGGYAWWVPEVYGSFGRTFNAAYLLGPTMPRNPYGNLPIYLSSLCGLDGFLNGPDPAAPRFYIYPFSAAVFIAIGAVGAGRSGPNRAARRIVFLGLGFLGALLFVYLFYFFTEVAFILPACFVMFVLFGHGATVVHRRLAALWRKRRRSIAEHLIVVGVVMLDLMLVSALGRDAVARLSVSPRDSQIVPALRTLDRSIEPDAAVVSNVSLQFLELYIPGQKRSFVGLHSFDPGGEFTDYHLGRLYAKKSNGWEGPIPLVLFDGGGMIAATVDRLVSETRAGRPARLLLWTPTDAEYAGVLKEELNRIGDRFALEPEESTHAGTLALYRIRPR